MSYIVLARKYRPQEFDKVIGQEHITDIVKKAIEADRVAHAYLFCGPRGIGKTSCARILAKSLNCEKGPTLTPCEECSACKEITKGTSFDVLEIDGASNRGIDEIRALRENVKFAPSFGKYKIYIVDEVHMLTGEAFNALLKTLEEPPEHVKFIFATTAPNKLPSTIISRCQRFDFKRVSIKTLVDLLSDISAKESVNIDEDALFAIAKASGGSIRDSLSILDQMSALGSEGIHSSDVCSMLGLVETQLLFDVADALIDKDCSLTLKTIEEIVDKGKDIRQLTKDLIEHFRNLMIIKVGGKSLGRLVDHPVAIKEMFLTQSQRCSLKDILITIDTFIAAQETARITDMGRLSLEMAFAKLTYSSEKKTDILKPVETNSVPPKKIGLEVLRNNRGEVNLSRDSEENLKESVEDVKDDSPVMQAEGGLELDKIARIWDDLTSAVSKEKMSLATYLQEGRPTDLKGSVLTIAFSQDCSFHKEVLDEKDNTRLVENIFGVQLKAQVGLKFILVDSKVEAVEATEVKSVLNQFEGEVVNRWHNE
ncbi:DNA polymerase III subunits gamma and tau [hydrothermal vent metagenome]|uniref:DNA-directed DNA polymerase n=1 Tax=hydrothermal vent metagenome TaxID=652676 RepID=A0A3B0T6V9_9ZZZZ